MYLIYLFSAGLMVLFAYRMNKIIKDTYEEWEMSCWEITLHCFALVFPLIILTLIMVTGNGMVLEDSKQAKERGRSELRDFNIFCYFLLEVAKAVIYSILLFIVTKYSATKKRQEEKQNEFLNETADAFIQDMNSRTTSWLQSNPLFSNGNSQI